jgi:hypothetical protein
VTLVPPANRGPEPPRTAGERDLLVAWLDWHRATIVTKCEGLTASQLAQRTCPPSDLTLLGLVRRHRPPPLLLRRGPRRGLQPARPDHRRRRPRGLRHLAVRVRPQPPDRLRRLLPRPPEPQRRAVALGPALRPPRIHPPQRPRRPPPPGHRRHHRRVMPGQPSGAKDWAIDRVPSTRVRRDWSAPSMKESSTRWSQSRLESRTSRRSRPPGGGGPCVHVAES